MKTIKIIALSTIVSLSLLSFTVRSEESAAAQQKNEPQSAVTAVQQTEEAPWSWSWITSKVSGATEWLKANVGDATSWVGQTLVGASGWVQNTVRDAVQSGSRSTQDLIENYGKPAAELAIKQTAAALKYAQEKGIQSYNITKEVAADIYQKAIDYTTLGYQGVQMLNAKYKNEGAKAAIDWLRSESALKVAAISDVISQKLSGIAEFGKDLVQNTKSSEFSDAIKSTASQLSQTTQEYVDAVKKEKDKAYEIYAPKIQRLTSQLSTQLGKLKDTTSDIVIKAKKSADMLYEASMENLDKLAEFTKKATAAVAEPATTSVKVIKKTDKKAQELPQQVPAEAQKQ